MNTPERRSPEQLQSLFSRAAEAHKHGQLEEAKSHYLALLEELPAVSQLHYNLGLVYYEMEIFDHSRNCFARAAEYNNTDTDILFNLALSQKQTGDINSAIKTYKQFLQHLPNDIDCLYNLAGCYKDTREHEKAITVYIQVLGLDPEHQSAMNNLAYTYQLIGNTTEAVNYYRKVMENNPDHEAAQHMLASLTGSNASSSPDSYIRDVFDNYSDHYEQSLVTELKYNVPHKLRKHFDHLLKCKTSFNHGIDLGCGTGLSGDAFADIVANLDGIDLSEKMISLAADKGLYSALFVGNLQQHLENEPEVYDFFLAADVFTYLGDLREIFTSMMQRSEPDALLCFSTETTSKTGYHLQPTGRFAHSPDYIEKLASETGWTILDTCQTQLRKEKGSWIQGDLWFLTRSAESQSPKNGIH